MFEQVGVLFLLATPFAILLARQIGPIPTLEAIQVF